MSAFTGLLARVAASITVNGSVVILTHGISNLLKHVETEADRTKLRHDLTKNSNAIADAVVANTLEAPGLSTASDDVEREVKAVLKRKTAPVSSNAAERIAGFAVAANRIVANTITPEQIAVAAKPARKTKASAPVVVAAKPVRKTKASAPVAPPAQPLQAGRKPKAAKPAAAAAQPAPAGRKPKAAKPTAAAPGRKLKPAAKAAADIKTPRATKKLQAAAAADQANPARRRMAKAA